MSTDVTVVVGGQAGSEGKGAVCDALHRQQRYTVAVRVGGPNAGHTVVDREGRRFALRQLPVASVSDPYCDLMIAAGSEVDVEVLEQEIRMVEDAGYSVRRRLSVDREATLIDASAVELERNIGTGTTGKGIGGARAQRALRQARRVADVEDQVEWRVSDTQHALRRESGDGSVLVEGTQGYVLGTHAGYYPYATSGNCRAADFMAWCGFPPQPAEVWIVLRMHPIRIAGDSGPMHSETTWANIGVPEEKTTVTKKVRRVGYWDPYWAIKSIEANTYWGAGMVNVALTFVDYDCPELSGQNGMAVMDDLPIALRDRINQIKSYGGRVRYLGTGERTGLWL